ncbi:MAG: transglutaminase domain-containing protein [Chloroflexi bacterium]|nr:transglutaminase domain-containing protein [Chloroflexota bacterium]
MSEVRYSAGFRIFAFLAVSCCIAAVAWAIRDPWLPVIGICGLAMGHFYSWRQRDASIRRSLILLIFMVLTVFLGRDILLSGFSDRLLLSRYLIYGLTIGSFDLMRRRNVVASLILGGLLLVLISELALQAWFLVFPVAFTILALVAVALSRLEAESNRAVSIGKFDWQATTRFWLSFTGGTLLISVIFFLLMPRLASSQITQANWLPSRLDLGIDKFARLPGKPGASATPGILPSLQDRQGDGETNYATLGYIGTAADVPVMYVRSRISSYWRGLVLDRYDGRGWLNSSPQLELRRQDREWFLLPDSRLSRSGEKEYWQAYYLLSDQPNAVFTGYWPGRIHLAEETKGFLERGTLYRVQSLVPGLRPEILRTDRVVARNVSDLTLPPISERTAALAEAIVRGAPTDYDKATRLERFLLTNYPYALNVGPTPPNRDAVDYFLFEQQAGDCSHFATAMAVMARHVGLPARVAAGYLPGYIDPLTGVHVVRAGDAHAWVEIDFQQNGWVAFDPTPRLNEAMGFATARNWVYFGLEEFTGVSFTSVMKQFTGVRFLGSLSVGGWLWLALLTAAAIIASVILLSRRHKRRSGQVVTDYSSLDGEARKSMLRVYDKMVTLLVRKGLPSRQRHQAPYEYGAIVRANLSRGWETVEWLTRAACYAAYDPVPFDPQLVPEANQRLFILRRELAAGY